MKSIFSIFLCGLFYVTPSYAQTLQDEADSFTLSKNTLAQIQRNPDQFIEQRISQLFNLAPDGVLTIAILDTHEEILLARLRSHYIEQLLQYDLNANLMLDATEVKTVMAVLDSRGKAALQTTMVMSDVDQDGTLSMQEIADAAVKRNDAKLRTSSSNHALMEFDMNRDGEVTPQEISKVVAHVMERN